MQVLILIALFKLILNYFSRALKFFGKNWAALNVYITILVD